MYSTLLNIFIDWLIQPLGMFTAGLFSLAGFFLIKEVSAWIRRLAIGTLVGVFLLFSSPMFANFLVHTLEQARQNPYWCDSKKTALPIVVLGGGKNDYVSSTSVYDILQPASIRRVAGAADIANDHTQFYLLGGGTGRYKEAELMAQVLIDRGVPIERIVQERNSLSTMENAQQLARLLAPSDQLTRVALVTSSLHVPRASRVFERAGFEVCHYATDVRYAKATLPVSLLPYVGALSKSTEALHEYIGYFYYWLNEEA